MPVKKVFFRWCLFLQCWIFTVIQMNVYAQPGTCSGSLGDPVVNITFGSGVSNPGPALSASVPGASTNYNYAGYATGNPPAVIFDGDYALVTGVPTNGAWFTGARDHTGDPGGYMAFFNAAPTPGEFYRQTVSGLCPGTTYEFAAWVANVLRASAIPGAILPNITFRLLDPANQQELASYSTGNIAMSNTMTWQQYSFLFTLPPGSSSVTLVLANNNIGGSAQPGNDLAIDDITFRPCGPQTSASFSSGTPVDTSTIQCGDINLFGTVSGGLTSPAYQWQISTDGGNLFNNISGATSLSANLNNLSTGNYIFRLLTAEAGNIGSTNCRFTSNQIRLTVTGCNQGNNGISGIVNDYTPVLSYEICRNRLLVEDATAFKTGDTVLIIQMKGAIIDSSNTPNFGNITNYRNAGKYEMNYVDQIVGNQVQLKNFLINDYDLPDGRVQLIRVPFYQSATVTDTLTCLPWDGRKGGVLVLNVGTSLTLNSAIDVSRKGFRGGIAVNSSLNNWQPTCQTTTYFTSSQNSARQDKGEGIAEVSIQRLSGRGPLANGGGGANLINSGGGGGSNGSRGGIGGQQFEGCSNSSFANGGIPGMALTYSATENRIFAGGGGGAGDANDPLGSAGFNPDGGNGGGIIIINAESITSNTQKIIADGSEGKFCQNNCNEGMGGGGAGGTILLAANLFNGNLNISATGGKGGNNTAFFLNQFFSHGPGGGGSGGTILFNQSSIPTGVTVNIAPGQNGISTNNGNISFGAQPGSNGIGLFNFPVIKSNQPFKPAIDSIQITAAFLNCNEVKFTGQAFMNRGNIQNYSWTLGDNTTASGQEIIHQYGTSGTYIIKLTAIDNFGCSDSFQIQITVNPCPQQSSLIFNSYAAVNMINFCTNSIIVDDAASFRSGDTVLLIQMKGASINNTNSNAFGTVNSYNDAGLSEINYVDVINGNTVLLKNKLLRNYDAVNGAVQLIRVPFFPQLSIQDTITCLPWDGRKGGVVVLNSAGSIGLSGVIDVSGKGFKGGGIGAGFNCNNTGNWAVPTGNGGTKGEGIAAYPIGQEAGGARLVNGGGGSYSANTGGGGGGNGGAGGNGGNQTNTCPAQTFSYGGEGYQYADNDRVFMGGGGGGGQQDDGQPVAPGGNGGGIVLLLGDTLNGNNGQILANGESVTTLVRDEGGAGGGAGGSVIFYVNHLNGTLSIEANGGDGSSNENQIYPGRCHGPGGGGGGGWIGTKNGPLPPGIFSSLNGGRAGRILNSSSVCFNSSHGAQDGASGLETSGVQVRIATLPFVRNIDSVRFDTIKTGCRIYRFNGNAYTNTNPVSRWEWDFGDGNTDTVQNTTHTYLSGGTYLVKLVITDPNGCRDSFSMPVNPQGIRFDYIFEQDACSPVTIHLQARGESSASIYWSMGDGTVYTNSSFPSHTYADTGTYLIRYHTGSACDDTLSKRFQLAPVAADIIATADTTLCLGTGLQLRSRIDSTLSFCWRPTNFLQNPASANPYAQLPGSASYELLAQSTGSPVNPNGDFSAGFTGFGSDYTEGFTPLAPGQYMIAAGSSSAGPGALNCTDRSQPAGSMLLLLSGSTGSAVKQPVPLVPDQSYRFSMWVLPLVPGASDTISILLNGIEMARDTLTGTSACNWQPLHFNWNAGILNTAEWSVRITGNSFIALDDIRFVPLTLAKETIRITVDTAIVQAGPDVQVCPGIPVQLNATGASGYSWSPATGLSATNIANPLSNPAGSISYTVTGSSAAGCTAADTIRITLLPVPQITLTADTGICRNSSLQLQATGGISFSWQPAAAFSNPSIPNPVVNPAQNTTYYVTVTGTNTCTSTDSVKVTLLQPPVFSISNPQDVCKGIPAQLTATGGDQYTWLPAAPLNNAGIANPLAVCDSSTSFTVFIRNSRCNDTATLSTRISIRPAPVVTASKSNDISCNQGTAQLQAAGAASFSWLPVTGLSDPGLPNPVARPLVTTLYTVTGTNPDGCSATASVEVLVDQSNRPTFLLPNAFSPNGDGLNDCFGIKYFGQVLELQLLIYNRYGEPVFFTSDATACWDGTYKGKPALAGNYVYYLKAVTACGRTEKRGNLMLVR